MASSTWNEKAIRDPWRRSAATIFIALSVLASGAAARGQVYTTITTLTASPASVNAGAAATYAIATTLSGAPVSGQVDLCDGNAKYCEGPAMLAHAQLTSNGTANIKLIQGIGAHSVYARYTGSRHAAASVSGAVTVTVNGLHRSVTTLMTSGSAGNYTMSASVAGSGTQALTNMVSFVDVTDGNLPLGSAPLGTQQSTRSFPAVPSPAFGSFPQGIAAGDFNGDGIPDLAVTSYVGHSLNILIGNGDGSFTVSPNVPQTGNYPAAVISEDFNRDGNADLMVVNAADNTVQVFLGNGDGTFAAGLPINAGIGPSSLVAGDFNGDGLVDVAVTLQGSSSVQVLTGDGQGNFTLVNQTPAVGETPYSITAADFNGDGVADLAVANYFGSNVTLLIGVGDGTFTAGGTLTGGIYPSAITAGDFNGDGRADLAVANNFSKTVSIFLGNGQGGFTLQPITLATDNNPLAIVVGDFNGDGKQDIAVTNESSGTVDVYAGNGNGTFAALAPIAAGGGALGGIALDLNGDGQTDIAVVNQTQNTATAILNMVTTTASASLSGIKAPGGPVQSVAAVYPGDASYAPSTSATIAVAGTQVVTTVALHAGAASIAVGQQIQIDALIQPSTLGNLALSGSVGLFENNTEIAHAAVVNGLANFNLSYPAAGAHTILAVYGGDANFGQSTSGTIKFTVVNSAASATVLAAAPVSAQHGAVVTLTATVTSGGAPVQHGVVNFCNAAAAHCEDGAILRSVQLNGAGVATVKVALPVGNNSIKAIFTGTAQVKSSVSTPQAVTVTGTYPLTINMTATGAQGSYTFNATASSTSWQSIGGVSGNLPLSLVDTSNLNLSLGAAKVYPQQFGFATPTTVSGFGTCLWAAVAGDFNGDGRMDIAEGDYCTGALTILLSNGNGTFLTKKSNVNIGGAYQIVTGDFNGDGKLDLAAVDYVNSHVTIALGNGDGTFTGKAIVPTDPTPTGVVVGDFNGDGIPDLAVCSIGSANVNILLGKGDGTFQPDAVSAASLSFANSIAMADFNGDGNQDLVVAAGSGAVLLFGNGDGTFAAPVDFYPNAYASAVSTADFNGDGLPDIALGTDTPNAGVAIFLNQGNGQFTTNSSFLNADPFVVNIAIGDFNGDGAPDLAFAGYYSGTLNVAYNTGNGTFLESNATIANSAYPSSTVAADFDLDGGPDLLVASFALNDDFVFLNRSMGSVSFGPMLVPGAGTHALKAITAASGVYAASASNAVTTLGTAIPASVLVVPAGSSNVLAGQAISIAVKVLVSDNFAPTGTASLFDGTTLLKTSPLTGGQFTYATTFATTGTHYLSAVYNGDANLATNPSLTTPIYVTAPTTTTLALAATTMTLGTAVLLKSTTVTAANLPVTKGVVNFCDATAAVCQGTALLGTAQLTANGTASVKLVLGQGAHPIKSVFNGSQTLHQSFSAVQTLTITGLRTAATRLTQTGNPGLYSLAAAVTGHGPLPVTGQVSFVDATSNTTLGQATLGRGTTALAYSLYSQGGLGNSPFNSVVADFNGDGKQDIAFVDSADSTITVLLGNGNGSFTPLAPIAVAGSGQALAVGDFNGDGKPDLAAGGIFSQSLTVLLGNGNGTFVAQPAISLPYGAYGTAVGDVNQDGIADLVVTGPFGNGFQVLIGDGTGNFAVNPVYTGPSHEPTGVTLGDFNGDGNLDIAIADVVGAQAMIFFGDGAGTFTPGTLNPAVGTQPEAITAGDFNKDGKLDLALSNFSSQSVTILLGKGDGTFGTGTQIALGFQPLGVLAADMNLDGALDLVVSGNANGEVTTLIGNGTGSFTAQTVTLASPFRAAVAAIGDFNNDGMPDVIVPNLNGKTAQLLLNGTSTTATATLAGVTITGSVNHTVSARYAGSSTYAAGTSNTVSLAP